MSSFKNIIDNLQEFSDNHLQINSFGWGNPDNISTKDVTFPMLFAAPVPGFIAGTTATLFFDIYILDLETQDFSNLLEIMNKCLFIGNDVISEFFEAENGFEFDAESVSITPFEAKFDDHVAGWIFNMEVTIKIPGCKTEIPSA